MGVPVCVATVLPLTVTCVVVSATKRIGINSIKQKMNKRENAISMIMIEAIYMHAELHQRHFRGSVGAWYKHVMKLHGPVCESADVTMAMPDCAFRSVRVSMFAPVGLKIVIT